MDINDSAYWDEYFPIKSEIEKCENMSDEK